MPLQISEAPTILKIPVLPISYGDAQHFLAALGGRVEPPNRHGSLPIHLSRQRRRSFPQLARGAAPSPGPTAGLRA